MNQALLLRAVDRIIAGIEIGDEYTPEVPKHALGCAGFTRFAVHECHIFQVGEYPYISVYFGDFSFSLIRMHQLAASNAIQDRLVSCLVPTCLRTFQVIDQSTRQKVSRKAAERF